MNPPDEVTLSFRERRILEAIEGATAKEDPALDAFLTDRSTPEARSPLPDLLAAFGGTAAVVGSVSLLAAAFL